MGNKHSPFEPLDKEQADELEFIINKAASGAEAVVIDPQQGVTGAKPVNLISPNSNTNALVRYGRHYFG